MIFQKKSKQLGFSAWTNLKSWRPYFIIFLLGFVLYGQALFFNFTELDDTNLIIKNSYILSDVKNIGQIFLTDVFFSDFKIYYRPILNLSLMVDYQVGGELPVIYHFSNILLHLIATSLVFYFLFLLTKKKPLAFLLSLFFLVHPALTQVAVWIPGRNDSLLTVFVLATFIFFLKFLNKPRPTNLLLYLLFFLIALFTKETAAVLPFLIIFYYFFINRGEAKKTDFSLLVISSGALLFIWSLFRNLALNKQVADFISSWAEIIAKAPATLLYLGKTLLPFNPAPFPNLQDSTLLYGVLTLIIITGLIFLSKKRRNNYLLFGLGWFLIFMLPFFILSSPADFFINFLEHRLYLPLVGFLIIISEIDWLKNLDFKKWSVRISAVLFLLILATVSFIHSRNFQDSFSLWKAAVRTSPSSVEAQKNLGLEYFDIYNFEQAEFHYLKALELNENEVKVHNNLGVLYLNQGRYPEAEEQFKKELEISQATYQDKNASAEVRIIFDSIDYNLNYLRMLKEQGKY